LEWLGGGRWRLSVTRGRAANTTVSNEDAKALRRISTVEGSFENVRRVALRAFRTLELEAAGSLLEPGESELETTVAYPIALDALTPPVAVDARARPRAQGGPLRQSAFDEPTPLVTNPFEAITAHGGGSESRSEPSDVTLVFPPPFSVSRFGVEPSAR
jgi:hypothetical protein